MSWDVMLLRLRKPQSPDGTGGNPPEGWTAEDLRWLSEANVESFGPTGEVAERIQQLLPQCAVTMDDPGTWARIAASVPSTAAQNPGDVARERFLTRELARAEAAGTISGRIGTPEYLIEWTIMGSVGEGSAIRLKVRGSNAAMEPIQRLSEGLGAVAIVDGVPLDFAADPAKGLQHWRAVRNAVASGRRTDVGSGADGAV